MDRTLHLLIWITVMTASAYKCKQCAYAYTRSDRDSSIHYDYPSQGSLGISDNRGYDQMSTRSADISPASHLPNVPDDVKIAQRRIADQTPTRAENESKGLSWKPYAESRRGQNPDKIVFPGPTAGEFQLDIPEKCKRLGFCEDIPNYPTAQVKKVISELSNSGMFQVDKLDLPEIVQRLGPYEDNIELCDFEEKVVYPKAAIDPSGKWHVVLNQDDNPVQGFKVEICKNYNEEQTSELKIRDGEWQDLSNCTGVVIFVNGYEGRCKQKYVYRKMQVLLKGGSTLEKSLKVPSCCSCVAKLKPDFMN